MFGVFIEAPASRNVNGSDSHTRLTGNPFECLASCEDAGTLNIAVDLVPSSYGSPAVSDVPSPTLDVIVPPISGANLWSPALQNSRIRLLIVKHLNILRELMS